VRENDFFVTAN